MDEIDLESDCSNCAALCCVALAFDKSTMFAIDKPAGIACPNLASDYTCAIHKNLQPAGFQGCMNYDCDGAGQRVTQSLFAGRSWRDSPAILTEMLEAFRGMRQVHARLVLLKAASKLPLSGSQKDELACLQEGISHPESWSVEELAGYGQSQSAQDIKGFLQSLAGLVSR